MMKLVGNGLEVSVAQLPKQDEYILLSFNPREYDPDDVFSIYKSLQEQFPLNKIVVLPIETQVSSFSKEEILEVIENLKNYINYD